MTAAFDVIRHDATTDPVGADAEVVSIFRSPAARRSRAERQSEGMPWLSVKLPWGMQARLLNISSTGLLLESGSKLMAGSVTEIKLCGPGAELTVAVSFVRSELAEIDRLSVKYHTALAFKEPLQILEAPAASAAPASAQSPLSQLLTYVSAEIDRPADSGGVRAALERGMRQAVGATEIQILDGSAPLSAGGTSLAFPIGASGSPCYLHASFAQGDEPTEDQVELLKTAAGLAAVVLDFDNRPRRAE